MRMLGCRVRTLESNAEEPLTAISQRGISVQAECRTVVTLSCRMDDVIFKKAMERLGKLESVLVRVPVRRGGVLQWEEHTLTSRGKSIAGLNDPTVQDDFTSYPIEGVDLAELKKHGVTIGIRGEGETIWPQGEHENCSVKIEHLG